MVEYKVAGRPVELNKGEKSDGTDWTVTFKNGKTTSLANVLALIEPKPELTMKEDSTPNLINTLMSSGKVNKPTGGASMNGKYYHLQGGTKYDVIHFDYDSNSEKPFGVVQVAGHHLPTNLLNSLGFRETRSWTAGVEVYIADGNLNPKYISEEEMAQLVDEWGKGVESYAKSMGDFYKDRGKTSGTIDEAKEEYKVGDKVTYSGNPAEITFVGKDQMDRTYYNVSYDKGYGKTKTTNIYNKGGEIEALEKEKKSKFKKHGEMSGFDMRGINEQMDIYDEIANEEFGMDYDQLGSNEKEWVRDEIDNMSMNEAKATCCHRCGRVHVKGTPCKRPYLKGKDSCAVKEVQDLQERLDSLKETKSAPEGHYFTKSGNLVKGRMTKDAEERGARKSDPKDKMRSKIPKVTQYAEAVKEYMKKHPKMKKSKMMETIRNIIAEHETDPALELMVGDYQTKHYHMCPGAKALYQDIESKGVDMDLAVRTAKLQDALFAMEEEALDNGATEVDLFAAETVASQIMDMARMMGLEEEHSYIQGHITKIKNALIK